MMKSYFICFMMVWWYDGIAGGGEVQAPEVGVKERGEGGIDAPAGAE